MDEALRHWCEGAACRSLGPGVIDAWEPLAVEASHRRFYRLSWHGPSGEAPSLVAMSSPPALENNTQFVTLATLFAEHGIGVPRLAAADAERGYFLMSDLGTMHFSDVYEHAGIDSVLPAALDTLHRLQVISDPRIPPYTRERFADELDIYRDWFLGALLEASAPAALDDVFRYLLDATEAQPTCCVHRDFHSRNLLLRADGGVGVVDFQDALMGPATYDLASILRDCYYRVAEPTIVRWRDAYLDATSLPVDRAHFAADLDLTALQRQLKAVGIFARLHLRDQRDSHLSHILPVLTRIGELTRTYPRLRALTEHVDAILPATRRRLGADR